jgi:DNA-binding NarL/FixJ family response regulator
MSAALATIEGEKGSPPDSGRQRRAVLDIWLGLVEGRLQVVECVEARDRRHYLVRSSEGASRPGEALDVRERRVAEIVGSGESEKAAAYALGIGPSMVSALLKSTLRKLGLRSRIELVMLVRSML